MNTRPQPIKFSSRICARALAILLTATGFAAVGAQAQDLHFSFDGDVGAGKVYQGERCKPYADGEPETPCLKFVEGRKGQAVTLSQYAVVAAPLNVFPHEHPELTVTAWIRRPAMGGNGGNIFSSGGTDGMPSLFLYGGEMAIYGGRSTIRYPENLPSPAREAWTFVAGVWNFNTQTLRLHVGEEYQEYSDQSMSLSSPGSHVIGTPKQWKMPDGKTYQHQIFIGAQNFQSMGFTATDIAIDDVKIFRRALTPAEILDLAREDDRSGIQIATLPQESKTDRIAGSVATNNQKVFKPKLDAPVTANSPSPSDGLIAPKTAGDQINEEIEKARSAETATETQTQKHQQEAGPKNRALMHFDEAGRLTIMATPEKSVFSPSASNGFRTSVVNHQSAGRKIVGLGTIWDADTEIAVTADGSLSFQGPASGRLSGLLAVLRDLKERKRPLDLIANRWGGFLIISGDQVIARNVPQGAKQFVEARIAAGKEVSAVAFVKTDGWVAVSETEVRHGGLPETPWREEFLADLQSHISKGERIEDIDVADAGSAPGWAIATDSKLHAGNMANCNSLRSLGYEAQRRLGRTWQCTEVRQNCLADRATWDYDDMSTSADPSVWEVNVLVAVGSALYRTSEEKDKLECWLEASLKRTEALFSRTPRLAIKLKLDRKTQLDGISLSDYVQETDGDHSKFMDKHFDIVAKRKTEGYFQVLLTDDICIGYDDDGSRHCIGGRATFPHWVSPLSRKHGFIMNYEPNSRDWVFAHELGHYLGLAHTFEKYVGVSVNEINCNKDYDPEGRDSICRSCVTGTADFDADTCTGRYNFMDYCNGANDDVYINACQADRAARQKARYMTSSGQTNYFKMKGTRGTPYCTEDGDCANDEYCNKGVAGLGFNVCKIKLQSGQTCSRGGQCESGKCNLLRCK